MSFLTCGVLALLTACSHNRSVTTECIDSNVEVLEADCEFGISSNQYNCQWKLPNNEKLLNMSDDILNGRMWVLDTMEPLPFTDLEKLDWNAQHTVTPNTFQLYLQCLNPVIYLTKAYELTENDKYLDMAKHIIFEWQAYQNSAESEGNAFVWYDHGTALRAEVLIYYCLVAGENGKLNQEDSNTMLDLVNKHAEYLASDTYYTENHNHGIFQDRALIYCAYFLDSEKSDQYMEIAKNRLEKQKEFAFSTEMVHVENSPGYQVGVMDIFRMVSDFLVQFDDEFGQELYEDIKKSAEFMAYITKPNGLVGEIGDTNSSLSSSSVSNEKLSIFGNEHLTYASTQGLQGMKPEENAVFYPESGYYVCHNSWEKNEYSNATWQMFKSGYSSKTHKHADDNSFMLYSKGYDIFVDPGWYNYMSGNKYRDYFVSSAAHNTVIVDGKSYSPTDENSSKVGMFEYEDGELYDYVLGYNNMYPGVKYDRHYYNLGDAILLYDNMVSEEEHTYKQLFHTSEYMELVSQTEHETIFKLADTGYYVRVKQLLPCGTNNVVRGDFEKETFGYISREMGHLSDINTVIYEAKGQAVDFLTLITIEDYEGKVLDVQNIQYDEDTQKISVVRDGGESYEIQPIARKRINSDKIITKQINLNTFLFTNENGICENDDTAEEYLFAWYVIDKQSAKVIHKSDYAVVNTFEYSFADEGEYLIKAYTRTKNNRLRTSAIVAVIGWDAEKEQYIEVTNEYPYLNLVHHGQKVEHISGNRYKFIIEYDYSWNSNVKWYVYRNGGYYTVFSTQNENSIEYEFVEPGTYTIMYYLTTPNGDNEFWNFEELIIE